MLPKKVRLLSFFLLSTYTVLFKMAWRHLQAERSYFIKRVHFELLLTYVLPLYIFSICSANPSDSILG